MRRWRALIAATGAVEWIEQLDRLRDSPVRWAGSTPASSRGGAGRTRRHGRRHAPGAGPPDAHRRGQTPIAWSSSAPGWPVCRRRCTWPAAAARSPSWNAARHPGGRVGRLDIDGYRLDTGPDGADDARHHRRRLRRRRRNHCPTGSNCYRSTPPTARCSPTAARWTSTPTGRDGRRDRAVRRPPARPTGYLRLRDWLTRLYRDRVRRLHRAPTSTRRCRC